MTKQNFCIAIVNYFCYDLLKTDRKQGTGRLLRPRGGGGGVGGSDGFSGGRWGVQSSNYFQIKDFKIILTLKKKRCAVRNIGLKI